jgi:hypothetical protein
MSHYCVQARQRNEELAKQLENALLEKQTAEGLMSKYFAELRSEQCLRMQLQMQMAAAHQLQSSTLDANTKADELEAQLQKKDKLVQSLDEQVSKLRTRSLEDVQRREAVVRELTASKELAAKLQRDLAASKDSMRRDEAAARDRAGSRQQQHSNRAFECTHCFKVGHTADKCWELHPELKSYCNQCRRSGHPTYKCHFFPPVDVDDSTVRNLRRRLN